ncbi:MAG: hypothetical protein OXU61_03345 [Gammaproteobacteria bacterium]|nr:hypothetical protein [Gammaproteobacteria bacterium]
MKGEGEEKGKYEKKVIQGTRRTNKLVLKTDFIFYTEHAGRNDLEVAVHPEGVTLILWVMYRFKKCFVIASTDEHLLDEN